MNDYLWDRSAPVDPEIAKLERTLAPLAYRGRPFRRRLPYGAIAASIVVGLLAWQLQTTPAPSRTAWKVTNVAGEVSLGRRTASVASQLHTGEILKTGVAASVTVEDEDFGEIHLSPESRLRMVESRAGRQRMSLERGRMHALIWAPPSQFVVDTPAARAVDLGCEYDLAVDADGNGFLEVETGWVAFQFRARESFIPAGAACRTTKHRGPGVPFYKDAPARLLTALEHFESAGDAESLQHVIASARPKDGLTLWHLLTRVSGGRRAQVFDRFASLVALPPAVDRERVLDNDPHMLDLCWNALSLEDAAWWRNWKQSWKP
jgi:hypothetical protein